MASIENVEHCANPDLLTSIEEDEIVLVRCVRLESVSSRRGVSSFKIKALDHTYFEVVQVFFF